MSEEDKQIMARISQLAGHINRHKNQQHGATTTHHSAHHRFSPYRGRGAQYGSSRVPLASRHRTLILNSSTTPSTPQDGGSTPSAPSPSAAGPDSTTGSGADSGSETRAWVQRNDRHRQLINSDVYEQDSQARAKAMAESRRLKEQAKDAHEQSKLEQFARSAVPAAGATPNTPSTYEILVEGIPFSVTKNGAKLVKIPGRITSDNPTPKTAMISGVRFYRSKNGNLYRNGVVEAQRHSTAKLDQQCKHFSSTGSCPRGPRCRYMHDASKVAICKDFLKGSCVFGEHCDLSHDATPQRTPTCLHFARGNCTKTKCVYAHSAAPATAPLCRAFGYLGYCENGAECADRHVLSECPDFTNSGRCNNRSCKLLHRERASVLRKSTGEGDFSMDVSSDDEAADSDDVDSDAAEEFIGAAANNNGGDTDFSNQKDYIAF